MRLLILLNHIHQWLIADSSADLIPTNLGRMCKHFFASPLNPRSLHLVFRSIPDHPSHSLSAFCSVFPFCIFFDHSSFHVLPTYYSSLSYTSIDDVPFSVFDEFFPSNPCLVSHCWSYRILVNQLRSAFEPHPIKQLGFSAWSYVFPGSAKPQRNGSCPSRNFLIHGCSDYVISWF